jgi:hypothetical protein
LSMLGRVGLACADRNVDLWDAGGTRL